MSYRTPLYDHHTEHEARMIDFHGWEMPVHYSGILDEHQTVRTKAGIFDLSHMGEIAVSGPDTLQFLNHITCNNTNRLSYNGKIIYTGMLNEHGGFIDDLLIYRKSADACMLVVNAANREKDLAWIQSHAQNYDVTIEDQSFQIGLVALQGPSSVDILKEVAGHNFKDLYYYHFTEYTVKGHRLLISRTGYTGEDGFEIYGSWDDIPFVWNSLLEAGRHRGIKPVGLGARDTLRLEVRYPLHGSDIDESTTPLEAGLSWIVDFTKDAFIGKQTLVEQKNNGVPRMLIGFVLNDKGVPRAGYEIRNATEQIGTVTSGTMSPSLLQGIGMGYVDPEKLDPKNIYLTIHEKPKKVELQKGPFIRPRTYTKK